MTTHYTASDGKLHAIADMAHPHLRSATAKLEGRITDNTHRLDELAAMKQELARRATKFAADVALLKAEGFACAASGIGGWFVGIPGQTFIATGKTAEAAWFKAIAVAAERAS